ncbi:hypothetical protein GCM10025865_11160 [Paraoerskovia sediminicola]|uniref:GntR C-terminal domain-containing protein n=1 Tax=Paraoerskovia sediminicola TaxID=1138587 RepID=A0ABM8G175_9CELL|nr:hypothetical protein GCM10025865_11160 [Paraoerskovia sediminicola]
MIEAREALEASAARRIVRDSRTAAVLPDLDRQLAEMRAHVASGDVRRFVAADDAFHAAVVDHAGNALVADFYARLRDHQQRLRHHLLAVRAGDLAGSLDDHERLRSALGASDDVAYAAVLGEHVARYRGAL